MKQKRQSKDHFLDCGFKLYKYRIKSSAFAPLSVFSRAAIALCPFMIVLCNCPSLAGIPLGFAHKDSAAVERKHQIPQEEAGNDKSVDAEQSPSLSYLRPNLLLNR